MSAAKEVHDTITDEFIINLAVAHSNHKVTSTAGLEYEVISHERLISFSRALLFAVDLATPFLGSTETYQERVASAHHALFHDDPTDVAERLARFMEEANETCQALGMSREDAHRLVDYTYDRPAGEPIKEIGAAMLTLTSLCVLAGLDLMSCAEADLKKLQRPETIARIRAKRSTRHGRGPLPGFDPSSPNREGSQEVEAVEPEYFDAAPPMSAPERAFGVKVISDPQLFIQPASTALVEKASAFDQIVAARKAHIDAVDTYNVRLEFVQAERQRGNWLNVDPEYTASTDAQKAFWKVTQELADAALSSSSPPAGMGVSDANS